LSIFVVVAWRTTSFLEEGNLLMDVRKIFVIRMKTLAETLLFYTPVKGRSLNAVGHGTCFETNL
jgi:hypothetical protein